jgi:exonuclease III
MKIITWNVNNRVGTVSQQVQALGQREPDVVMLQDVNRNAVTRYLEAFRLIGLSHVMQTLARQPQAVPTGVLIASRSLLSPLPDMPESILWSQGLCSPDREKVRQHWARRTLFALLHSPWGEIEVANVYITPANHKEPNARGERRLYPSLKLDLLSGVYQALAIPATRPRLLCGDFNTPQHERTNGEIITWGFQKRQGIYYLRDGRQHELEFRILHELSAYGLPDIFRRLHGYAEPSQDEGWSWCYQNRIRYRFDHIFASTALCPIQAQYLHTFRELHLSDHAPLEALFEPTSRQDV